MLTVITVYYFAIHFNSFCDLRTHIAVEVYGVQPQVPIPFFLIMCVTVAGLLLFVMFVFCIIDLRRRAKLAKAAEMDRIDDFDVKLIEYVTPIQSKFIQYVLASLLYLLKLISRDLARIVTGL